MYTSRTLFPSLRVVGENRIYNIRYNMNLPIPITAPYSAFLSSSALTVTGQRVKIAMTMANAKENVERSLPALEREFRDGRRRMAILKRMEKRQAVGGVLITFSKRTRRNCHVAASIRGN